MTTLYARAVPKRIPVYSPDLYEEYTILPDDWTPEERECVFHLPYFYEDDRGIFFTSSVPQVMAAIYMWQRDNFINANVLYEGFLDYLGIEGLDDSYARTLTFACAADDGFVIDVGIGEKRGGCREIYFAFDPITIEQYHEKYEKYY